MKKFSFTEVMEMVEEAHKEEKKTIHAMRNCSMIEKKKL